MPMILATPRPVESKYFAKPPVKTVPKVHNAFLQSIHVPPRLKGQLVSDDIYTMTAVIDEIRTEPTLKTCVNRAPPGAFDVMGLDHGKPRTHAWAFNKYEGFPPLALETRVSFSFMLMWDAKGTDKKMCAIHNLVVLP